ncbi:hypothetical protein N7451_012753 [Penicillium sp. IBT 35674x]|nr:hypothetical protein N7451_012753 [Penicillium sp. IBT 35674x]
MPSEQVLVSTSRRTGTDRTTTEKFKIFDSFPAQHAILKTIQNHLEDHIFRFLLKWLSVESQAVGWTCVEAIELHKVFEFLADHKERIEGKLTVHHQNQFRNGIA